MGKKQEMDYENLLLIVGGYGKYQKQNIAFILIPVSFMMAFSYLSVIFMVSPLDHWCYEPELETFNLTPQERKEILRPAINAEDVNYSGKCFMRNMTDIISISESRDDFLSNINSSENFQINKCKYGWEFDRSLFQSTVVSKWDLVCDQAHIVPFIFALNAIATSFGLIIYSFLSDRFGRRPIFLLLSIVLMIFGAATALVESLTSFFAVRFMVGTIFPSGYQIAYIVLLENVDPNMRTRINGISCLSWSIGLCCIPLVAYLSTDWITLAWIGFGLSLPFLLYFRYFPESARWMIARQKYEDATKILFHIGKTNKVDISYQHLLQCVQRVGEKSKEFENKPPIYSLLRRRRTRSRLFLTCTVWVGVSLTYYGFHLNVAHLYGNILLNFLLLGIVELPSTFLSWYCMRSSLGRRWTTVMFTFLMTFSCFATLFSESVGIFTTVFCLIGKFGAASAYDSLYQQVNEMFPTNVRSSCLGIAGTIATILSIVTPYIIYLSKYGNFIPYIVLGCIGAISVIAALFLPETLNVHLPQTLQDSETFFLEQKFFSLAKTRMKEPEEEIDENMLTTTNV